MGLWKEGQILTELQRTETHTDHDYNLRVSLSGFE